MSDKKYYWLKLPKDFFKRHDIVYICSLPNGQMIVFFYLKLMVESIDHDGELRFSEDIPYSDEMLASITTTDIETVKTSMKVLGDLGLAVRSDDGTIILKKVKNMVGYETKWAEKKRAYREQKRQSEDNVLKVSEGCPKLSDKSKSKSKSKSIERNTKESGVVVPFPLEDFKPAPTVLSDEEVLFNQFWAVYPKKVDKKGSFRAFKNIPRLKEVFPGILQALEVQKQSAQWTKDHGQFIPNPTTYIHQERWLTVSEADEVQSKINETVRENYEKFLF